MAKYKIIPSSKVIVRQPISIGHKAEKGVEAIEFDLTAWVETYGSGTLTVIMRRWGDAIPYPIALEIDENNKAVWTLSDIDTAKAGMAYAQLNYIVGDEVVKKSDIYTFRVMDSLTGEGEPPEAYESWLERLTHFAAEAMAEVLDIEGIVTDKTLTVDGGIADAKATGEALAEKVDAADYSALSARVGANTIALAEKADRSTTYTKAEVDQMIEDVEVETDTTLAISGAPADAAETGRQIGLLKADLDALEPGLSDTAKVALLNCFAHVAWTDEHGQTYYDALESALYADSYPKITAVFNAGSNVIYTDTALNTLKQYLAVKYYETKDSAGTVVASTDYSLTGTLVEGLSTVSVSYDGLTTSCVINGVVDFYNIWEWSLADGDFTKLVASTDRNSNSLTGVTIRQDSTAQYRRNCSVTKGILPYTIRDTETLSQYYPIPVPATANKVTVSVTPDTQFTFLNIVKYDSATNKYNYYAGASNVNGWTQGVNEKTFTASENLFLFFNVKYDSAGTSYPAEPSNITVTFEEV